MGYLKINSTKNYRLFMRDNENRGLDPKKHKKLVASMKEYGYLPEYPLVVRDKGGKLLIVAGQHRLAVAEMLGLAVYWTHATKSYDVAEIEETVIPWNNRDYAIRWANKGHKVYNELLEFAEIHSVPLSTAGAMLGGVATFSHVRDKFRNGTFEIRDRAFAERVVSIYRPLKQASNKSVVNARCVEALMAVCRVSYFEPAKLVSNMAKCRERIVSYSTRDAYLEMLQDIYNFHRRTILPLKVDALNALKGKDTEDKKP